MYIRRYAFGVSNNRYNYWLKGSNILESGCHFRMEIAVIFNSCVCLTSTIDPHISEPQLSNLPDYPNTLLMKFIGFLVHFKWNCHSCQWKCIVLHIWTFHISELGPVPWCSDMWGSTVRKGHRLFLTLLSAPQVRGHRQFLISLSALQIRI